MFNWLIKKTKLVRSIESQLISSSDALISSKEDVVRLQKNIEDLIIKFKAGGTFVEEGNSSIVLEIDSELNVSVKSRINKDITNILIDHEYITSAQSEDESAINFAFILIANEATEQVIENINAHEEN